MRKENTEEWFCSISKIFHRSSDFFSCLCLCPSFCLLLFQLSLSLSLSVGLSVCVCYMCTCTLTFCIQMLPPPTRMSVTVPAAKNAHPWMHGNWEEAMISSKWSLIGKRKNPGLVCVFGLEWAELLHSRKGSGRFQGQSRRRRFHEQIPHFMRVLMWRFRFVSKENSQNFYLSLTWSCCVKYFCLRLMFYPSRTK